jgi:hypothetical protein
MERIKHKQITKYVIKTQYKWKEKQQQQLI